MYRHGCCDLSGMGPKTGRFWKGHVMKMMKTKTLMTMAVAGAFGLSAAAFAGPNHEVITPFSVSESGQNIVVQKKGFHDSYEQSAVGATSDAASAWLRSASSGSLSMDESIALANEGIYSDFYVVSYTPVMVESWDLYVLDTSGSMEFAAADESTLPTHELALISSDDGMSYELALVPTDDLSRYEIFG